MTDVLAGWALAGLRGCLLIFPYLLASGRRRRGKIEVGPLRPRCYPKLHRLPGGAALAAPGAAARARRTGRK